MEYEYIAPPLKSNSRWMGHHLKFYVNSQKEEELWSFLERTCGPKGEAWRLNRSLSSFWNSGGPLTLRFVHKKHAMLVKLQWVEDQDPLIGLIEQMKNLASLYTPQHLMTHKLHPITNHKTPVWSSNYYFPAKPLSGQLDLYPLFESFDSRYLEMKPRPEPKSWLEKCRFKGSTIFTEDQLGFRLGGSNSPPNS